MIKITYNHQNPFAHRFISHLEEPEAQDLIFKYNSSREARQLASRQPNRSSKRRSDIIDNPMTPQETKILTQFSHNRQTLSRHEGQIETRFGDIDIGKRRLKSSEGPPTERREAKDIGNSLLSQFQTEQHSNVSSLKESYLRLWYEKMALENQFTSLQNQSHRKDESIAQLRQELGHKKGPQVPSFFNPQTPASNSSHGQNKSNFPPNQSTSLQSHTLVQQSSSSGLGHWNSMHPNKNLNQIRSNF